MKRRSLHSLLAAFSMVELMVACGLFAIASTAAIGSLIRMNHNASLSRLQTGASTLAQNRIDQFLGDRPFNPREGKTPPSVALGTVNTGSSSDPQLAVYTDPATGSTSVGGWMTTTIENTNTIFEDVNLNIYRISVSVSYNYRGKTYQVSMASARCPDE